VVLLSGDDPLMKRTAAR